MTDRDSLTVTHSLAAMAEARGNVQNPGRVVANVVCCPNVTPLTCRRCACQPQGHTNRGSAQRSGAWCMVAVRKHIRIQRALLARAHNANVDRLQGVRGVRHTFGLWRVYFPPVLFRTDRRLLV